MARMRRKQRDQEWARRVSPKNAPLTGNNLSYGPVTGLGDFGMHLPQEQAASYVDPTRLFLSDAANAATSLSPAIREEFARILKNAYASPDVTLDTSLDLSTFGLSSATTVRELQGALMNAYLPETIQFARTLKTAKNGVTDLVSEAMLSFPETIKSWEPGEGSFMNYMQYGIRGAMVRANRAVNPRNVSFTPFSALSGPNLEGEEGDGFDPSIVQTQAEQVDAILDILDPSSNAAGWLNSGHPDVEAALQLYYEEITGRPAAGSWKNDLYYEVLKRGDGVNVTGNPVDSLVEKPYTPYHRDLAARVDPGRTSGNLIQTPFYVPKGQSLFEYGAYGLTISENALTRAPFKEAVLRTPRQVEQAFSVLRSGESINSPELAMRIEGALKNAYVLRNEGADFNNLPANWPGRLVAQVKAENVRIVNGRKVYRQFEGIPVEGVFVPTNEKGKGQPLFQAYEVENASGKSASYVGINKEALTENPYEIARVSHAELELYGDTLDTMTGFRREARAAEEAGDLEWARTLREEANSLVDPEKARVLAKSLRTAASGLGGKETIGGNVMGNMGAFENAIARGKYDAEPTAYSPNELGRTTIPADATHQATPRSRVDRALAGIEDPNAREAIIDRARQVVRSTAQPGPELEPGAPVSDVGEDEVTTRLQAIHQKFAGEVIIKGPRAAPGRMNHEAPEYSEQAISFDNLRKPTGYAFNGRGTLEFEPVTERQTRPVQYRDADGRLKWKNAPADRQTHVGQLFTRGRVPSLEELRTAQKMDREGAPVYGPAQSRRPEAPLRQSEERQISAALNAMTENDPTAQMSVDMARRISTGGYAPGNFIQQWKEAHPALGLEQAEQFYAGRNLVFKYRGTEASYHNNAIVNSKLDPSLRGEVRRHITEAFARRNRSQADVGSDWEPAVAENTAFAGSYETAPEPEVPPMEGLLDMPQAAPVSGAGKEPDVPPLEDVPSNASQPPAPADPERRPVQGAATPQTMARTDQARRSKLTKTAEQAYNDALQGRRVLEMDFPDYIADHLGRGPENKKAFEAWRSGLGDRREAFEKAFGDVMYEKWHYAPEGRSVYSSMIKQYGWKGGPASNQAAPAAAQAPVLSKDQAAAATVPPGSGQYARVSAAARKLAEAHGINPYQVQGTGKNGNVGVEDVRRAIAHGAGNAASTRLVPADQINSEMAAGSYDDEHFLPADFFNVNPVTAMDRQEQIDHFLQARIQAEVAQLRQIDHEWTRQLAEDLGIHPDGSQRVLTEEEQAARTVAQNIRTAERLSGEAPTAEERAASWVQRLSAAKGKVASLTPQQALKGRSHALYGEYNEVSNTWVRNGAVSVTAEEIGSARNMVQGAFTVALGQDLSGLSPKEIGATVEKRVRENFEKTLKEYERQLVQQGSAPDDAKFLKKKASDIAQGMIDAGMSEVADSFGAHGYKDLKYGVNARGARGLSKFSGSVDVASRLEELGGEAVVAEGPLKVLQVGDNSLTVGASPWGGGPDTGAAPGSSRPSREDQLRSLYSSLVGHVMMAQFMGSMAWKSTGGAVLDVAQGWAVNQYGYVGLEAYGGGEVGAGPSAVARQEIASNRTGALAYEQYGFMRELGYAYYNPAIARFTNDAKVAGGVGLAAGIGGWAAGGMLGMGMAGATAFGTLVGTSAAAVVGIPAALGTSYNLATDQDSYAGWSLKNMLAGYAWSPGETDFLEMERKGFKPRFENFALFEDYWLRLKGAAGIGSAQEEWSQRMYGISAQQYTEIMGRADPSQADWLFEGRSEESTDFRKLTERIQEQTSLKEDVVTKGLSAVQVAFGGLNDKQSLSASFLFRQSAEQGVTVESLLSGAGQVAQMRGIKTGTEEFEGLAVSFASRSPVEQQAELSKASRDFQKYAQWVPYLQGGNAEGYQLFNALGGTVSMAQTQSIQQAFAQAQQFGVDLTPAMASSFASVANSFKPYQAQEITRMAASMSQMGVGPFVNTWSDIATAVRRQDFGFGSDVGNGAVQIGQGNQADTLAFLQGVTSGNPYALSDYGRMAGIGVLQSMDHNGLQTGLKDMSGLLLYAQQNILKGPGLLQGMQPGQLTGAQTLAGLGLTFNQTDQNALLTGGLWGYQQSYVNQANALQAQGMDLQFQQLGSQRQYMHQSWGLENQMNAFQWGQQQRGFYWQETMLDANNRFRLEDAALTRMQRGLSNDNSRWTQAFDYQTSLMRRDWAREDYQFNTQMRQMSFGWNMEDMDEQIRRSSGYERAMLVKQRDRAVLSENMQSGQAEKQMDRQEQLWQREDERYQSCLEYSEKMMELDTSRFELNQQQADEMYQLQKTRLAEEKDAAEKLHDLRMEVEKLQRERQEEQLRHQEQSLDLQKQQMLLQNEYADNMTTISHTQSEMEASLRKITSYSPAFSRMLADFLTFLEDTSQIQAPSPGGRTYR